MVVEETSVLAKTFFWIANVTVYLYFVSPAYLFYKYHIGKFDQWHYLPGSQVFAIIFNCMFWVISAFSTKNITNTAQWETILCNAIGLSVGFILIVIYWAFSYKTKSTNFIYLFNVCNITFQVGWLIYYLFEDSASTTSSGMSPTQIIASVFNIVMYASLIQNPLLVLKDGEVNPDIIPYVELAVGFASTLAWLLYGLITLKNQVIIPNIAGIVCLATIFLFCLCVKSNKPLSQEFRRKQRLRILPRWTRLYQCA